MNELSGGRAEAAGEERRGAEGQRRTASAHGGLDIRCAPMELLILIAAAAIA